MSNTKTVTTVVKKGTSRPVRKNLVVVEQTTTSRRRRRRGARPRGQADSLAERWGNLLADPWNNVPMKLGLGTMLPTTLYTFYKRGSLSCNADGSFGLALLPTPTIASFGPIMTQNAGAGTATWSGNDFYNSGGAATMFGTNYQYRVLGAGLRAIPSIAGTSAPGELSVGSIPCTYYLGVGGLTPTGVLSNNFVKIGSAIDGGLATSRPQDLTSFEFTLASAFTSNTEVKWSAPIITGVGLPASTVIYYEAIMHCEILPDQNAYNIPGGESGKPDPSGWASVDQLWNAVSGWLPSASAVTSHFDSMSNMVYSAGRAAHALSGAYTVSRALTGRGNVGNLRLRDEL